MALAAGLGSALTPTLATDEVATSMPGISVGDGAGEADVDEEPGEGTGGWVGGAAAALAAEDAMRAKTRSRRLAWVRIAL
jgi:hypothetical protein